MNRGVFKTIVYHDCLGYPLTAKELEVFSFKDDEDREAEGLVEVSGGFYFLKGRKDLVKTRKERAAVAKEKWNKALRAVRWLRVVPYIRAVFASGSLALGNTDKESDLDVLLVVKHGRIWTARLLTVLLLSLLGVRRTRYEKIAPDKICLNHFITDKSFYIPRKSIYTAQLYARLTPILSEDAKLIDKFIEANSWVGEYIAGWPTIKNSKSEIPNSKQIQNSKYQIQNVIKKIVEKIMDTKLGDWLERILRKYQLWRINNYHLTHKSGGRVKADDESLEFHPDSPELKIIEKYNRTMIELGFPELANEADSGLRS